MISLQNVKLPQVCNIEMVITFYSAFSGFEGSLTCCDLAVTKVILINIATDLKFYDSRPHSSCDSKS